MNTLESIKTRRSTRKYTDEPVSPKLLEEVIEAGRYAPSGGNSQSTHFLVIKNPAILRELAELVKNEFSQMEVDETTYRSLANAIRASKAGNYTFHYNAPVLILTANKEDYSNNLADCACAVENMMVAANELDLGSCWINQLKWLNENRKITEYLSSLGLEEGEKVYAGMILGYADTEDGKPQRNPLPRTGNPVTIVE